MTKAEYIKKQQDLLASIRKNLQEYNSEYNQNHFDKAVVISATIDKDVAEYNSIAQVLCFDECASAEDPMRAAILMLHYPVISVKDVMIGDEVKVAKRVIIGDPDDDEQKPKYKAIDLLKFQKYVKEHKGVKIGYEPDWNNKVERLNYLFALDCAVELNMGEKFIAEMSDCYAIKEASKNIDFGVKNPKAGTPISNTNLLKALKAVITAMIGPEYAAMAMTHDVRYLKKVSAKKSRKELTVACANHRFMRGYVAEVCYRIMTEGSYDVEYKKVDPKKK